MLDATIVRAHQHSVGAQKKPAKTRPSADRAAARRRRLVPEQAGIHAVVDALGNPVALSLTPGQAADISQAEPLLEALEPGAVIADKGYDADALVKTLEERNITPVIPAKANREQQRPCDFALYRERNLVERFFNKIKHYRAIATRFDKLASTFLAGVMLVRVILWLN